MKTTMKKRKKSNGIGNVAKPLRARGFSFDKLKDEMSPVLMVTAGVLVGNMAGKLLDKFIKPEEQTGIKAAIKPAVLLIGGAALKIMVANKMLKDVGTGIAISGVLSGVKKIDKSGTLMGDFAGLGDTEPVQIGVPAYTPDLPELPTSVFYGGEEDDLSSIEDQDEGISEDAYQLAIGEIEDAEIVDFA